MATQTKKKSDKTARQTTKIPKKNGAAAPKIERQKRSEIDPQNLEAIKMLREWDNFTPEEIKEQKETWAFLKKALDEDRLSPDRPFSPEEAKDVSS